LTTVGLEFFFQLLSWKSICGVEIFSVMRIDFSI
jgi:hypothetical protein